ncbi:MAG: AmmeMemoRadiSam system protein A [Clostridiales bacterium]|nr:AmmeMemoRadiSam system protein A [Clostridiales bacterium]
MSILASFMVPHPPLIIPDVGRGGEKKVIKTIRSYEKVADEISSLQPETIIITSPHALMYSDYFHISPGRNAKGSFARFGAPEVSFDEEYDTELVDRICSMAEEDGLPCGTEGGINKELDHGTMVPLWFIRNKYKGGRIVRIGLSGLPLSDHFRLGQVIRKAVDSLGRRAVFIASGDLSHKLQEYGPYGFVPEGPQYDERIMDVMSRAAFDELLEFDEDFLDTAAECGHRSFVIMAGSWNGQKVNAASYSHEDVTGVGYGICSFHPADNSGNDIYVRLARLSLESYIHDHKKIRIPEDLAGILKEGEQIPDELLSTRAGAFVSLHKDGELRGCIGTIGPTSPSLAQEIANNAISASTRDPRFYPVETDELSSLEINVDVLGHPEDISSADQLDVKRYGVIVSAPDGRRGLLLPDLEGVDTVEYQVAIAMQKGGIRPDEPYHLQRFEVVRHV